MNVTWHQHVSLQLVNHLDHEVVHTCASATPAQCSGGRMQVISSAWPREEGLLASLSGDEGLRAPFSGEEGPRTAFAGEEPAGEASDFSVVPIAN